MKYRVLGSSGIEISVVGMGCWAIGGKHWGPIDDSESIKAIQKAASLGISFFDTADVYGFGHSEEIVGKALRTNKDVIIATKVGLRWNKKGQIFHDLSPEYIKKACEASLKRLNRDVIDLYQMHWPDTDTPLPATLETLDMLIKEGKIRYVGSSNFDVEMLKEANQYPWFVSNQGVFNLFNQKAKADLLPYCDKNNIAFIAYEPLFKGMLTGKFKEKPVFPKGDHRTHQPRFSAEFEFYKKKVDFISGIASENGLEVAPFVLALLLGYPGMTTVIPGIKTAAQAEQNACATAIDQNLIKTLAPKINSFLEQ